MFASNERCLEHDELKQVLAGRLPADAFDSAISHLDNCDSCRNAVETIESDEKWIAETLDDSAEDPLQAETACQVALWRMLQMPVNSDAGLNQVPCDHLGPYKLLATLGTGGMGTVYLAQHKRLKRQCAVKLLPRERVDQQGWLERFDREMTTIASLEHPNIVQATDAGHQDGWHYLVMEHLEGLDVGRVAHRMQQLSIPDACEIIRQAALGLAHVHEAGLVHRDIKPSNLMLTQKGIVKLLDLGLVLDGDDPLGVEDRLTTVGHMMGTMAYMAPEQLADSRSVDSRADIYALGATLFRLIAGRPPHQRRGTMAAHILAITNDDAPKLDTLREDVDRNVVALVGEMLSRDPANRPSNALDIAKRLEPFSIGHRSKGLLRESLRRSGSDSSSVNAVPSVSIDRKPPRNPAAIWIMATIFAACVLAGFLFKVQTDKGDLVVHSEQDNLTLLVKQADKVVDRLVIKKRGDNRIVLQKGTYQVEIEGGGGALQLSDEVVTISRKTETPIQVLAADVPTTGRLYEGKPLAHWMNVLQREQNPKALGEAMKAVEVLSRDTDQRAQAAMSTLHLARELGGIVLGNENDPSHYFMSRFTEVYPLYLPDPGIQLINTELKEGTDRSRMAAGWALSQFFDGAVAMTIQPGKLQESRDWCANKVAGRQQILDSLAKNIAMSAMKLREIPNNAEANHAAASMVENLVELTIARRQSIIGMDLAESAVRDSVAAAKQASKDESLSGFGSQSPFVHGATFIAAAQLATTYKSDADWDFLALCLMQANASLPTAIGVFEIIRTEAPDKLLQKIEDRLHLMWQPNTGGFANATPDLNSEVWLEAINFFSEKTLPTDESVAALQVLLETAKHENPGPHRIAPRSFSCIENAIKKLEERIAKQ